MSESSNVILFASIEGNEGSAPTDAPHDQEQELQRILRRLTTELSDLAMVKVLPRAKALYEAVHPETRHGGHRSPARQVTESGTWPSFTRHVADTCGISPSTVYSYLKWAQQLESLAPEAESAAFATALANKLGTLARIAAIPDHTIQYELVLRFDQQGRAAAKELRAREQEFGLASSSTESRSKREAVEPEHEPDQGSGDSATAPADDAQPASEPLPDLVSRQCVRALDETTVQDGALAAMQAALGASAPAECLDGPRGPQSERSEVEELRSRLKQAEERCAKLEAHLALYEQSPLGELFTILGVTTVQDALARARLVMEVSNAAE